MSTGFQKPLPLDDLPKKNRKNPWNFDAPVYDERSSCYVNAGRHFGVGVAQPIGKSKITSNQCVPVGRIKTKRIDVGHNESLGVEVHE
jgi:hypothetical protein